MNLEHITLEVNKICIETGHFIKSQVENLSNQDVIEKGVHNLVTFVDKESEKQIITALVPLVKDAGFIAEEQSNLPRGDEYNWIVDPLDGTTNFVHGIPLFSISIALMKKDELLIGVVYEINLKECFYAWKGGGAFLNGKPIHVSGTDKLDNSLVATGFPYYDYSLLDPYLSLFKDLMQTSRGVRRLGSAAVDLAYVACGRFELFYEYGLQSWDVAAGALIVQEAGGMVTDFKKGNQYIFGQQLIASNILIHSEFTCKLQEHFKNKT
ncbi:MAG: inositol monophosphatase [Bacteroidetes bacterium CG18_big_fil_WC_8_21_14_2_50_41_14]|nr:MAG: inositol monophosphatase [Bacteroidetes bacterium CG18_big_fil_WC_8_21_14_2_50_41_14]PIY33736.1 MAG: inositol monophosphatase [Bacteroidetes bacterium CG_4_10_14_3_um_filter_42_6]PJB59354.1 MAG: inositol monophosphatase [Bacteroidetes bacterium CG_4_9_14_3_um_filter_41_19]